MKQETLENYVQQELTKCYQGLLVNEIKQEDVREFLHKHFPVGNPNFKFTIQKNPMNPDVLDIIPHNLYTGVFLKEGLQINSNLTEEVDTLYGKYKFIDGELYFEPSKTIKRVEIEVTVKK
jgi:hypothetical protein